MPPLPFTQRVTSSGAATRPIEQNSDKLNHLVRELFELSAQYDCVFEPHWISTHDNVLADALSRDKFDEFKGLWRT